MQEACEAVSVTRIVGRQQNCVHIQGLILMAYCREQVPAASMTSPLMTVCAT